MAENVTEVKEVSTVEEANVWLGQGWVLIAALSPGFTRGPGGPGRGGAIYILGLPAA